MTMANPLTRFLPIRAEMAALNTTAVLTDQVQNHLRVSQAVSRSAEMNSKMQAAISVIEQYTNTLMAPRSSFTDQFVARSTQVPLLFPWRYSQKLSVRITGANKISDDDVTQTSLTNRNSVFGQGYLNTFDRTLYNMVEGTRYYLTGTMTLTNANTNFFPDEITRHAFLLTLASMWTYRVGYDQKINANNTNDIWLERSGARALLDRSNWTNEATTGRFPRIVSLTEGT